MKKYAVLRGLSRGNRFWTTAGPTQTPDTIIRIFDGSVAYELLAEFDTGDECQQFLFGYVPKKC